jgi:predicted metalloprotease with PDZ domain
MNYQFKIDNPNQQYLQISVEETAVTDNPVIQLPSWRPGRYELGNFAKNIKGFKVFNAHGKRVDFQKITKDSWQLSLSKGEAFKIEYAYYANLLNAGSTFLDATQLYVNPVNCCVYQVGTELNACSLKIHLPANWQIATSLKNENGMLLAENFDELADSPLICSPNVQHNSYVSGETTFHMWFQGITKPDWERLLIDFKAFTDKQIEKFSEFPTSEYHFLFHILPHKAYHGVEHSKSTVICLGPSYEVYKSLYKELLGVSSHELYHTWNVKAIRPIEMYPYDFTKENYSRLGYLCEGVTTYMGDIFLLKSKVFTLEQYLVELVARFQIHFDNHARFNYSVAESSFDTWLDGYEAGAPNRKVSIYTEGSLLAFVADVMILKNTNNKYGLDEVMRRLYFNYALQGKGVSEEDYKRELEAVGNCSFDDYFTEYVYGNKPYESILIDALEYIGLELEQKPSAIYSHARLGVKCIVDGDKTIAKIFYPGGPADLGGMMIDDQIVAINGIVINGNLEQWLGYFDDDEKRLTINRAGKLIELVLPEVNRNFYTEQQIKPVAEPNGFQKKGFLAWSE